MILQILQDETCTFFANYKEICRVKSKIIWYIKEAEILKFLKTKPPQDIDAEMVPTGLFSQHFKAIIIKTMHLSEDHHMQMYIEHKELEKFFKEKVQVEILDLKRHINGLKDEDHRGNEQESIRQVTRNTQNEHH